MIIGIDLSAIPYGTGVSNYTSNLIKNLVRLDKKNTYKLFFSSRRLNLPQDIENLAKYKNVKFFKYKYPIRLLEILWNHLRLFPIENFIGDCDIFHCSDWTQAPSKKAKTVTTIHDLIPFLHPEWSNSKIVSAHKAKMQQAVKHCAYFICVSQNTKNDLTKLFPKITTNKISVVYEAAEEKFDKAKIGKSPIMKKQYGLEKYFLVQGTREPRKNISRIIEAFSLFKQKNPKCKYELAISGKYGWGDDVMKYKNSDIKILGYIPEKDIVALHANASALVYPSLYEGFGLPVIKSMKVGVPVITSINSSMSEITQDSAILVNPYSVSEIASAFEKICKNPQLRIKLSTLALKIAKNFSWTKTAQATLGIYQKML